MIVRIVAAFLAVMLVASVCLGADKPVTDDSISDFVRLKLAGDPEVKGGAVQVDVKNGVVTIGGVVETQRQRGKAAKLAKKITRVKKVVNKSTLKERSAGK